MHVQSTLEAEPQILVYDVGGSHVSAATCLQPEYRLGPIVSAPIESVISAEEFIHMLGTLGRQAIGAGRAPEGAELAFPGPFEYSNGISRMTHKLPYLFGVDLRAALAAHFQWTPQCVRFVNDAAAYLLGEVGAGAAKGAARAVCITLGTGIGSGFAIDGALVTGGPGVPPGGEIWNLPFGNGIVEDELSTKHLVTSYRGRTGETVSVSEIASRASSDPAAREVFAEFGAHLGAVLGLILGAFSPDVIVVGGGISKSAQLFLPQAAELLESGMKLRVSALQEHAPLAGAGVAWFAGERCMHFRQ